jgi:hypothetical protein
MSSVAPCFPLATRFCFAITAEVSIPHGRIGFPTSRISLSTAENRAWCVVAEYLKNLSRAANHKRVFPSAEPNASLTGRSQTESTTDGKRKGECMSRFQQGSLFKLKRKSVPDVWVFRWYENTSGKRTYKKQIIGSVTKLRNRGEAEKTVIPLRSSINAEVGTPKSVCNLAAHYRLYELTRERKAFSTIENYRLLFKRYIEPRWGNRRLVAVRTMEVEEWLHSLPLAPSSKAKLKCGRSAQPR